MRKCLLFVALLIVSQLNNLKAQNLFDAPDTVCVRQPVYLTNNTTNASSYYWGFCSGYLTNPPVLTNQGMGFSFNGPAGIEIAKDGGNYFGFVANQYSSELLRLDFGNSLTNIPTVTNFGNIEGTLPDSISSIYIIKDSSKWYVFVAGGTSAGDASVARYDFRNTLGNIPSGVNFGNPGGIMSAPRGLFVANDGFNYYGYLVDQKKDELIRLNFGNNLSFTPIITTMGNIGSLSGPSDMAAIMDAGNWYFLVTNETNSSLSVLDMGTGLSNTPTGTNVGNVDGKLFGPSAISLVKDCGSTYAFVTDRISGNITRIDIPSFTGTFSAKLYGTGSGALTGPAGLSGVLRMGDQLYAYATNSDNSLTQVGFPQCTNSSVASSNSATPPTVVYNTPGRYTVYLAVDEGLPTMSVECKQIDVLPIPKMNISNDTLICQGDSINLFIQSYQAKYLWHPYYNIDDTTGLKVKVWPAYSLPYYITLTYPNGCIVDTPIHVNVSKVVADAGPDRLLADGSTTTLGGPLTSTNGNFMYTWTPGQYLSNTMVTNPQATPLQDMTYYLQVVELNDALHCAAIDTVVVHLSCAELILPNAFAPESTTAGENRFGLLNKQIVKLNSFNIFDRWGKQVFTTTDPTKQWDGKINGDPAPVGVYVWEADGFCTTGQHLKKSGNVTLLR